MRQVFNLGLPKESEKFSQNIMKALHEKDLMISTFLLSYANDYVGPNIEKLILFCDSCSGQNKNHSLIYLQLVLVELDRFAKVEHF